MRYLETLKEAKMTALGLLSLIVMWLLAGGFLSGVEVTIFHIPLWAIDGTLGVWTVAIAIAATLSRHIKNADL